MRRSRYCIMVELRTTHSQIGRKPSSGPGVCPSERDLRRVGVGADAA